MPTTPQGFSSFVGGFDLRAANYSGGAGGTFANLKEGEDAWTVVSATPSFEVRGAKEGMLFTNSATQSIIGRMPMLHEGTIIVVAEPSDGTELGMLGGNYQSGTSFDMRLSSTNLQVRSPTATSAEGGTTWSSGEVAVFAGSWHPESGTIYAQIDTGAVGSEVTVDKSLVRLNWHEGAIGRARNVYFSGWIARVLFFSRALHAVDNEGLQELLAAEVAALTDVTAPIISLGSVAQDGTDLNIDLTTDETGTAYVVVVPADDGTPSEAEMAAGQASGGGSALASETFADQASGTLTVDVTGVDQLTDVYVMVNDIAGNSSNIAAEEDVALSPPPAAPTKSADPSVSSGDVAQGAEVTSTPGTYSGVPTPTVTRQWQRSADGSTGWSDISGATSVAYTTVGADLGNYLRVVETATNSQGSVQGTSGATGEVIVGDVAPSVGTNPSLPGTAPLVGEAFTATTGSYTGTPEPTITRQWERSDNGSTGWANISGATSLAYTPVSGDIGKFIRLVETATNSEGSADGTSAASLEITSAALSYDPEADTPSIVEWWDADTNVTETGSSVSTWASALSSGGEDFVAVGEFTSAELDPGGQNGLDVLTFNGVNDHMITAAYVTPRLPSFTFVAGSTTAWYGRLQEIGGDFSDSTVDTTDRSGLAIWEIIFDASGGTYTLRWNGATVATDSYTGSETAHVVMAMNASANAPSNANDAALTQLDTGVLQIGRNEGGQYGEMEMYEIVISSQVLTGTDLSDLTDYLNARWDLGLTPEAPSVSSAPTLPGSAPAEGSGFTATTGSYAGSPTPTITRQWERSDNGSTGWADISGATSITYTPVSGDIGKFIRLVETATNSEGSVDGTSAASLEITASVGFVDPSSLAATVEWWDPAQGITTTDFDEERPSHWAPASELGSGTTLQRVSGESLGPSTGTRTMNSLNVLDFDGSNDQLREAAANSTMPTFTFEAGNVSTFYGGLDSESGDFTDALGSAVDRSGAALWEIQIDDVANTVTLVRDGVQVCQATDLSWAGSGSSHIFMALDIDGAGNANDGVFTNDSAQGLTLGQSYGSQYGDFAVGDVVICEAILSGGDLTDMRSWFNTKWGF